MLTCSVCGELEIEARSLCRYCYDYLTRRGALHHHPRTTRRNADLMEDWEFLAAQGHTRAQAAERIGISQSGLESAIERHQRKSC